MLSNEHYSLKLSFFNLPTSTIKSIFIVQKQRRKPLSKTPKRASWYGDRIHLQNREPVLTNADLPCTVEFLVESVTCSAQNVTGRLSQKGASARGLHLLRHPGLWPRASDAGDMYSCTSGSWGSQRRGAHALLWPVFGMSAKLTGSVRGSPKGLG